PADRFLDRYRRCGLGVDFRRVAVTNRPDSCLRRRLLSSDSHSCSRTYGVLKIMAVEFAIVPPRSNGAPADRDHPRAPSEPSPGSRMDGRKRNGRLEPVDVNKIVRAVQRSAGGLSHVDIMRIAVKTIGGLFDGATTRELDRLSIQTAASLIAEEPEYSQL